MSNVINSDVQTASLAGQFLSYWWGQDFANMPHETAINVLCEQAQSMGISDPYATATHAMNLLTDWGLVERVRFTDDFETVYIGYVPNMPNLDFAEV